MKLKAIVIVGVSLTLAGCSNGKQAGKGVSDTTDSVRTEQTQVKNDSVGIVATEPTDVQQTPMEAGETTDAPGTNKEPMVYSIAEDGFLNIREMPVLGSKIIGKLYTGGEGAPYVGSMSNWHVVRYKGKEGHVNGKYAKVVGLQEKSLRVAGADKKVYYVVIGTYYDLEEAMKAMYYMPDAFDGSNVYLAKDKKGRTIYRMCLACYYDRNQARELTKSTNELFDISAWIWESDGVAPCVYNGISPNGEASEMGPE